MLLTITYSFSPFQSQAIELSTKASSTGEELNTAFIVGNAWMRVNCLRKLNQNIQATEAVEDLLKMLRFKEENASPAEKAEADRKSVV